MIRIASTLAIAVVFVFVIVIAASGPPSGA